MCTALPSDGSHADDEAAANGATARRGGRVRLQQLFQQYRQAQRRATTEGVKTAAAGSSQGPVAAGPTAGAAGGDPQRQRPQIDDDDVDSILGGKAELPPRPRRPRSRGGDGGGEGPAVASQEHAAGARDGDSDYDAVTAGFGERVSGVSYYPRYSPSVSMLQVCTLVRKEVE
jgi:hypothetical protein